MHQAKLLGIPVLWVSHQEVKYHRLHYGFKSKDDDSDAFTIALMYHDLGAYDEFGCPRVLPHYNHESIDEMRSLFLEREQMVKHWNMLINQLRQRLALEFPEICQRDFPDYNEVLKRFHFGIVLKSIFKSQGKDGICRLLFYETRLLYKALKKLT